MLSTIAIIAIACALRFFHIAQQSYWLDEMVSLHFAGNKLWQALFWDNHPPLYHLILKFWLMFFGYSEIATRGLSTLFSLITLFVLMHWLSKKTNAWWALSAGLLFALNPAQILMSQETRMYTFFEMTFVIQLFCFLDWVNASSKDYSKAKWKFVVSSFFLLCAHYLAILPIAIEAAFVIHKKVTGKKRIAIFAGLIAWLAALVFILIDWKYLNWQQQSHLQGLFSDNFAQLTSDIFWGHLTLGLLLLIGSFYTFIKTSSSDERFILSLAWISFFALLSLNILAGRNILFSRYFEFLVVPIILATVYVARSLHMKCRGIIPILLSITGILYLPQVYAETKAPWRLVEQYIQKEPGTIYTTRTLAIQTPYFERNNLSVERFESLDLVLENKRPVYIVESYLQGIVNLPVLQEQLKQKNIRSQLRQFQQKESDVILVLKIEN